MNMTHDKFLEVRAIENGTVIDHIPVDSLFKIIDILGLQKEVHQVTFGMNLESKRMGSKSIIKINDRYCAPEEINRIALVAPNARVNIIKGYKVIEKLKVQVPERVNGFVKCINPRCVTNNEPVATAFTVLNGGGDVAVKCCYCEKITRQNQFQIIESL